MFWMVRTLQYPGCSMMRLMLLSCFCLLPCINATALAQFGELISFQSPGNTTYYLDAETGNDEARGTRAETAWKTLSRVNSTRFAPGDTLYIKAGSVYHGQLFPKGSGIPGRPVTIDSYGEGARPAIHADGEYDAALLLENTNAWYIKNLELTNNADKSDPFRYGLSVLAEDTGAVGDFRLINLYIHDIKGEDGPGLGEGAAIIFRNRGANAPSRFDGLLVEGCTIEDSARHGICIISDHTNRNRWLGSVNVIIRENNIKHVAGDGIRLTGCENAIVEYNVIEHAGEAGSGEAGGVSLEACDNSLVQFNQVSSTSGVKSAAFRCGANSLENTFQFNFTRDNAGAMAAITANPTKAHAFGVDAGNEHTSVRYNISQNDHTSFSIVGPVREAMLYNNTVYCGPDLLSTAVRISRGVPEPPRVLFANNIFFTEGSRHNGAGADPAESGPIACC